MLLKRRIRIKHLLLLWLFSVLGFVVVLALATNLFASTVQETSFGNSVYFFILLLGFVLLGFLSFGLAVFLIFLNVARNKKLMERVINLPAFALLMVILAFIVGVYVKKPKNSINEMSGGYKYLPNLFEQREPEISSDEIFELTNNERIKNGLKPLKRNPKLDKAALERAKVIIEYDEFAHEATKSGLSYTKAVKKANYWNINYGENLASGQYTSSEVVDEWMNSESHRANILDRKFQEVGIATYSGELNGVNTVVTVQIFGGYEPPNYSKETIDGWINLLNRLREVKPSWENIKNFPSTYEANKQDADRIIEIINLRIYRIEKIINRMQANQWLTSEENKWIKEDEKLYYEQEAIAKRLNSQVWK